MHFSRISCVLAFASTALAGQCYNHVEGAHKVNCAHKDELARYAEDYCHENWNKLVGDWTDFNDRSGHTANIGKVANFNSKTACIAAFSQVVENCYDGWDGGQWVAYGTLLNINFCKWSAENKGVSYEGLAVRPEAKRVAYDGPREAKRVGYEGLRDVPEAKKVRPDAKRVRYEGPREAKRVAWDELVSEQPEAKRVGYQGLRIQSGGKRFDL
ncbi:hypothetical protein SS1G_05938 [Sclerotinia sclerotiorum 1980 UF-70]|uniref:Ecp2 effector protein domain-containing protein n=2 Tax=Sclerotinia sclerotiorum (strain ATCC 18683 / 1980 / Ss-1) TaxID=665079 RepID=A7EKU1_SCLS1|nr:hypothetical protein SS1G_05938 [Sclerotinia sclerotiorum 1980 UF-70]APA09837.1 hypothetical protein sscle_05g046070 [Sclerotinia sclerotiorum 1980 UF-70]EDO03457.1 hypothetical protein SS1G_05938 [Sclerotinia sclerotiorum 1980 UF-70]